MQRKHTSKKTNQRQFKVMSYTQQQEEHKEQEQQEQHGENDFEMVKVSIGFVRSLQDSILRLEQNQQHLIAQLDHANSLAAEYHETSCMYHQKYDEVLHKMEELKRKHECEIAILFEKIEEANQDANSERTIRQIHAEQIELLERQIAQQVNYASISQARTTVHIDSNSDSEESYGNGDDNYGSANYNDEILSPVSVASPSPRAPRYGYESPRLDPETPNADDNNSEDDHDHDHDHDQEQDEDEEESDNETEREFQMRYRDNYNDSQTTDCSGDPLDRSDTD